MKSIIRAYLGMDDVLPPAKSPRRGGRRRRPGLERLEDRQLLTTWFVAPGGSDSAAGTAAAPFRSIQTAVNRAAASGDAIKIAAGSYTYNPAADVTSQGFGVAAVVELHQKQLFIQGGFSTADWETYNPEANRTVIDGEDQRRGLFVVDVPNSGLTSLTLVGVTVTRGLARGIPIRGGVEAVNANGGGMLVDQVPVHLRDVAFSANRAIGEDVGAGKGGDGDGGGLALRSASSATVGILENVTFADNLAQAGRGGEVGGYGIGGGLLTFQYTVNGSNLTFTNNRSRGGGTNGSGRLGPDLGDGLGGGVAVMGGSVANLKGVRAIGNSATGGDVANGQAGGGFGGGVYTELATLLNLTDAVVRDNTAQGGNGRDPGFGNGGGVMTNNTQRVVIERALVLNNVARGGAGATLKGAGSGGGIAFQRETGSATSSLVNSVVAGNTAELGGGSDDRLGGGGGGVWINGSPTTITHATIVNNRIVGTNPSLPTQQGQGILLQGLPNPATLELNYSIIAGHRNNLAVGNNPALGFAAALSVAPGSTVNLNRNLFADNSNHTNANGLPSTPGTYNVGASSLLAASAGFVDAANLDFRLAPGSPAIDAATGSTLGTSLTGQNRQGTPDLGAYELGATSISPTFPALSALPTAAPGTGGVGSALPQVAAARIIRTGKGRRRKVGVVLSFSKSMNPARAQDLANYALAELRKGRGRRGAPRPVRLLSAAYNEADRTVTLVARGRPLFQRGARVTVRAGVTDAGGTALDGDNNGTPGGDAVLTAPRG